MDDRAVELRDDVVLVETKTEDGESRLDDALGAEGCDAMSISKYRLGIGLLLADDPEGARSTLCAGASCEVAGSGEVPGNEREHG